MIKTELQENRRASNIIWNAAFDYSFRPEVKYFDQNAKAELYGNYIIGGVHYYYDFPLLEEFFEKLKQDADADFLRGLTWLGLENSTFLKGRKDRPVLEELRRNFANTILENYSVTADSDILDDLKVAHFQRVLGKQPVMSETVANVLDQLEFDESLTTEQIIEKLNAVILNYFQFQKAEYEKNRLAFLQKNKTVYQWNETNRKRFLRIPFLRNPKNEPLEFPLATNSDRVPVRKNILTSYWRKYRNANEINQEKYIREYYGKPVLSDSEVKILEKKLCTGAHKNCRLHFTRGEIDVSGNLSEQQSVILMQREKNRAYFRKNLAVNNTGIIKLTEKIRNSMLLMPSSFSGRANAGRLTPERAWRNLYIHDKNVFQKKIQNEIGDLSVDILLDASASQLGRQEAIATQGFIIAESLTRCQIPVRVYSFCTKRKFTIMTLFRDYDEIYDNDKIFNYFSSGCNRDGLAIRTAIHMMKNSPYQHKLLIVLSDAKPLDTNIVPATGKTQVETDYTDLVGLNDTAAEVRKSRDFGISIMCVFTGMDEDLPSAKRIYGHNFVRIKGLERFADSVGILIQNELKWL